MKKFVVGSLIILSSLSVITAFAWDRKAHEVKTENLECKYGQCSKIKADGYRCRNCAQEDSYYCWSHNN